MKIRIQDSDGKSRGGLFKTTLLNVIRDRTWRGRPNPNWEETLVEHNGFSWFLFRMAANPVISGHEDDQFDESSLVIRMTSCDALAWMAEEGIVPPNDLRERADADRLLMAVRDEICSRPEIYKVVAAWIEKKYGEAACIAETDDSDVGHPSSGAGKSRFDLLRLALVDALRACSSKAKGSPSSKNYERLKLISWLCTDPDAHSFDEISCSLKAAWLDHPEGELPAWSRTGIPEVVKAISILRALDGEGLKGKRRSSAVTQRLVIDGIAYQLEHPTLSDGEIAAHLRMDPAQLSRHPQWKAHKRSKVADAGRQQAKEVWDHRTGRGDFTGGGPAD